MAASKPHFLIIWGDDIGYWNISHYSKGMMGYPTPNIDRIAQEGAKVGMPGATVGLQKEDPTIAELLKPLGYATGQFGKNDVGDRNEYLPTLCSGYSYVAEPLEGQR